MKPLLALALLTACAVPAAIPEPAPITIDWDDADSGDLIRDGVVERFRIHDVDAPETGGVGAAIGGAKCQQERDTGLWAKDYAISLTEGANVAVTGRYGKDRHGRSVVDISVNGEDYLALLVASGYGQVWDYDGGQRKPDWCG